MKSLITFLSLFASLSAAQAATIDMKAVWQQSAKQLDQIHILNPIVCVSPQSGAIELVFTNDFRDQSKAFVASAQGLQAVSRNKLNIKINADGVALNDMLAQFSVEATLQAGATHLLCVDSMVGLE